MTPLYVKMSDAPSVFSLSRDTFYRAANRGEITIHKRGSRSLLSVSQVSEWIEGRTPTEAQKRGTLADKSGAKN